VPRPRPDALALGARYRIALPTVVRGGLAGEQLGKGTGASLEFEDRRAYVPGDDVRHLDWRAFARTDSLQVRVYREEIVPQLDLLVDASASMAVDDAKGQFLADLVGLLVESGRHGALDVRIVVVGERPERLDAARLVSAGIACRGRHSLVEFLPATLALLRPRSMAVVVSDFLFPHAPADLVRPILARSGPLALVQLLGAGDATPAAGAAHRLVDAESGATLDVVLDARTVARYVERRARLSEELAHECRRGGAIWASLVVPELLDGALDHACRHELVPRGVVAPAD